MNRLLNISNFLIVIVCITTIMGCTTTKDITREHNGAIGLSKVTAATALKGAVVIPYPDFTRDRVWSINSVNETRFDYGENVKVRDSHKLKSVDADLNKTTYTYTDQYHTEWRHIGTVSFADITKITLTTDFHGGYISLYGNKGLIIRILCGNKPEVYNKQLAALVELCPNAM